MGPAPAAAFAGTSGAGADGRHRDLLPMPLPPASARNSGTVTRCRAVRRRSERVAHGEFLVTEVVKTLNEMYTGQDGPHTQDAVPPTAAQSQAVSAIRAAVHRFGQPPEGLSGAGALGELRVQAVYGGESAVLAPISFENIDRLALPAPNSQPIALEVLGGEAGRKIADRLKQMVCPDRLGLRG